MYRLVLLLGLIEFSDMVVTAPFNRGGRRGCWLSGFPKALGSGDFATAL